MNTIEKEFNIKEGSKYICIDKNGKIIKGEILDFCPSGRVVIRCKDGLYIVPYSKIEELYPIKINNKLNKNTYNVGNKIQFTNNCVADLIFGLWGEYTAFATTLIKPGSEGIIYDIDDEFIYINIHSSKYRVEKRRLINIKKINN